MEAIDVCATKDEFIKFIESDIPDKKFFRIDEVAEYFGVKSQTVRLWVKWNKIECEKLGASIRPVYNAHGELDASRAYVQVDREKVVAEFALDEIMYIMQNPQNDMKNFGYGLSPIESILLSVQASLQADLFNANTFAKDNIPPGILDLGDMSNEEAKAFIAEWNATVINDVQKLKFVWGGNNGKNLAGGRRYIPFQQNNKDMQFIEYIDWLSRLKLATYGLTTLDANLTQDVNRATSVSQSKITEARGVMSVKRLLEEYFNREIIQTMGYIS